MKLINLLPKSKQQELRYEAVLHSFVVVIWISLFSFLVVIGLQFGTKVYLEEKLKGIQAKIVDLQKKVNKEENSTTKAKVKNLNDLVTDYNKLGDESIKWSKVLRAFAPLPPDSLMINSFSVDPVKKVVTINGFSPTREAVIQLYQNILNDNEHFSNVDYPLENVAKPEDITFHFSFTIKDSLLK